MGGWCGGWGFGGVNFRNSKVARDILLPQYVVPLKNLQLIYRLYQPYITSLQESCIPLYLLWYVLNFINALFCAMIIITFATEISRKARPPRGIYMQPARICKFPLIQVQAFHLSFMILISCSSVHMPW